VKTAYWPILVCSINSDPDRVSKLCSSSKKQTLDITDVVLSSRQRTMQAHQTRNHAVEL
jgi:hypothetical protein